jgi:outer membrane receptor protein involved in Fe transport
MTWPVLVQAQDPFEGDVDDEASQAPAPDQAASPASEPAAPEAEPAAEPAAEPEVSAEASASGAVDLSVPGSSVPTADAESDATAPVDPAKGAAETKKKPILTGSRIRREPHMVESAYVIDSPLRTEVQKSDSLTMRRQLGGVALPDTTAALGLGMPGTSTVQFRNQPTLVLLNGRRLVAMPYFGPRGTDLVDINQLPIALVDHVELTYGLAAGLYGADAMGGVMNVITRRDFKGVELDLGGQITDKFDQQEADVSLVLGAGNHESGITGMATYFNRQPLAAEDREWISDGSRNDRIQSLLSFPAAYQPLANFDYPISDPSCPIAAAQGDANGYEARVRGYGPLSNLDQLKLVNPAVAEQKIGNQHNFPGADPGTLEARETATYCGVNYTPNEDLILKDERIQTYVTAWQELSDHTEVFGELGYYRSDNEQRTAPAFPILHTTPDINDLSPVWVPGVQQLEISDIYDIQHADHPYADPGLGFGFSSVDSQVRAERVANNLFIVGRTQGPANGSGINSRRVDVLRGVLGLQGDLAGVGNDSILQSWDWDVAGTYTTTSSLSRVNDTLLTPLSEALESCPRSVLDINRDRRPTTIKERQELGCFNPFYSSAINSIALDPLGVSNQSVSNVNGFVTTDSQTKPSEGGYGTHDGGYICDPNDPTSPACPAAFDQNGDGIFELAGTPNTKQVIDRITGEHVTYTSRTLGLLDAGLRGDLVEFTDGALSFGAGLEARRETLAIDYDAAYNAHEYGFLFGGPDIPQLDRNVGAGFAELRLSVLKGLVELQPAVGFEYYEKVGAGINPMVGLAIRPFASMASPPAALEWLLLRGHIARGMQPPSLIQLEGTQNEFVTVDYRNSTLYVPHAISGNPQLDFEKYTTLSGGLQWDFAGAHIGADFWMTHIDDLIAADNARTLVDDCNETNQLGAPQCRELALLAGVMSLDHVRSSFDNLANVDTNGLDGGVSYTFDSKARGVGDWGSIMVGAQGSYLASYLIDSPRALRHFYREGEPAEVHGQGDHVSPTFDPTTGVRDYSSVKAEYEAAGYRNEENFAPPLPKLRVTVPVRYTYDVHTLGFAVRYIDGYNDDSEYTIEERNLPGIDQVQFAEGEVIPSWMVFDASYGFTLEEDDWKLRLSLGVLNLVDTAPPAVQGPLGYEVGIHDARGRTVYVRLTGSI